MKLNKIIAFSAIAIMCMFVSSAYTPEYINIFQTPDPAKDGDFVKIKVDLGFEDPLEEVTAGYLFYIKNDGYQMIKNPIESLPIVNPERLTFVIGLVSKGDKIEFRIQLEFTHNDDFRSEWFLVSMRGEETTTTTPTTTTTTTPTTTPTTTDSNEIVSPFILTMFSVLTLSAIVLIKKKKRIQKVN